jgi:hypothetical protein
MYLSVYLLVAQEYAGGRYMIAYAQWSDLETAMHSIWLSLDAVHNPKNLKLLSLL